jgi:TetR/AcrR family transcriptional regulator, regulator of cefoperazone and chloramphenicol sensitivity
MPMSDQQPSFKSAAIPPSQSTTGLAAAESSDDRSTRGRQTRERLLQVATETFAQKGFQAATTREICELANSNMAAIHYHFGDKSGLYKAVLQMPLEQFSAMTHGFDSLDGNFQDRMRALYSGILSPLANPDPLFQQHLRIHFREMVDPTVAGREAFEITTIPFVQRMIGLLSNELQIEPDNPDVLRLAFAMIGMAMDLYSAKPCIDVMAPNLFTGNQAFELTIERLSGYACGMLNYEKTRTQNNHNEIQVRKSSNEL